MKRMFFLMMAGLVFAGDFMITSCKQEGQKGLLGIVVPVGRDKVHKDSPYVVTGVYEESPAFRAGIRPNDRIVQINGVEVEGLVYDHIYNDLLRGPAGTKITIVVERKSETLVFDVIRGE
jgi:C-terminal processing protease CtpA/Prc